MASVSFQEPSLITPVSCPCLSSLSTQGNSCPSAFFILLTACSCPWAPLCLPKSTDVHCHLQAPGGKETYARRMMHLAGSACFSGMHLVHTSQHLICSDSMEMWLELYGSQNLKWEAKQFLGMVVHKAVWVQKQWKMGILFLSSVLSRTDSRRLFFPK